MWLFLQERTDNGSNYITICHQIMYSPNRVKQISGGKINYSRQHVSEFGLPRLSQGLRTAVCHCSNVPAVWLGHWAIRLVLEPELELEVQMGLLSPGQGKMLMARRPHYPASNIWSRTICWGCQSPHASCTPSHCLTSPRRAQWEIKLLAG